MRNLIDQVRVAAGLSKQELAERAHTSRPTMSAYVHGHKVPRLDTAERIVRAAGHELLAVRRPTYSLGGGGRSRPFFVPDELPRLAVVEALATVTLPIHLVWSDDRRVFNLAIRRQRARLYEIVLREGIQADIDRYVDGALLVDIWEELVLPTRIRNAWQPLIDAVLTSRATL